MGIKKINMADALFSKVQQRVLALLFDHPEKGFYTNEIIRLTESGTGAVQRELSKLLAAKLVIANKIGNQIHYKVNKASPLFIELRGIILKTFGLSDIVKRALKPVASQIKFAFIYGSIAKQEDHADSDIDLLILSDKLTFTDIFPSLEKAEKQLVRKISPTIYSQEEWVQKRKHKNHFITEIIKQPKIFVIGIDSELEELR